jgi:nickel transport protein
MMRQAPAKNLVAALAALLLAAGTAAAHTAWIEPAGGGSFVLRFGGHEGKTESYDAAKLKSVQALDLNGRAVQVQRSDGSDGVRLQPHGEVALFALHFDNGFFSRDAAGKSVNRPMGEVPGATQGTWAVKYGKTIVRWSDIVTRPVQQPFEVVPLSAAAPRAGQPMQVRVLIDGKPAADIEVARGEAGREAVRTDAQGVAQFVPQAGLNRLWAGRRTPVSGDPRFTQLSIEYALVFEAR